MNSRVKISDELKLAIKRKRGELNITWLLLAKKTDVNRYTLRKIANGKQSYMNTSTAEKLNDWLYKQI
ncbi:hypothetical protein WOSG25_250030 [Weissella oryzae SG25]|uniref:HTH cro/C1-type domain-containing protein n=1 Tax=Weissella oryzae (strain DSM 25784 / JCM 18191 / LMG 30913 / SG25) TaxID=1329250 RepID=A0A069CXD6_WEIOS|nr:hypothetical protein [Weissella oryzae]GAK32032.1 hypothetical protein WOSG25_250030 [Weissella oryzae SG25]